MTAPPRRRETLHRPNLRVEKELLRSGCARLAAMDEVGRGALAGPVSVGVVVVTASIGRVPAGLRDSKLLTPAARDRLVGPVRRWAIEWAVGHAWPDEIDAYGIIAGLRIAARRALAQLSEPVDAVLLDGNHDYLNAPAQSALFDPADALPGVDAAGMPVTVLSDAGIAGIAGLAAADAAAPGRTPIAPAVPWEISVMPAGRAGTAVAPAGPWDIPVTAAAPGIPVTAAEPLGIPVTAAPLPGDMPYLPVHLKIKADLRCAGVAAASVLAKTTRDAMMVDYSASFPAYGWDVNKGYATPEHLAAIAEHGPCDRHRRSWRLSGPPPVGPMGEDEGSPELATGGRRGTSDSGPAGAPVGRGRNGKVRDGRRER